MAEDEKVETTEAAETAVTQPEAKQVVDGEFDPERAMNTIKTLRVENKELARKAKLADELQAKEKQKQDAELSEIERLRNEKAELEARVKANEAKEARRAAAEKTGLPAVFVDRLKGETPEELEADAQAILEAMPKPKATIAATNPPDAKKGETPEARRDRLYGSAINIFDTGLAQSMGGGVRFVEKGEKSAGE